MTNLKDAIDELIEMYQQDDPSDADFYTREWAQSKVAKSNKSPEEYLADRRATRAAVTAAMAGQDPNKNQPWADALPDWYKEKLCGPVDAISYGLMKKSGELAEFAKAAEGEREGEAQ
ncbi:MAG: hypothetical protein DM484_03620 [Candidatus Methylumidiphilus alinenensis]|uniref:Uncharacterized protein n=1 Tax=Candidatus Methylumidiphilus alinenensis TaxID=2202197 RepID=A0A2W4RJ04_9GAMM|nr:MAG: hypothetical protein DM484_03620 [Candidatus Methylumidiphilus alinenensis]